MCKHNTHIIIQPEHLFEERKTKLCETEKDEI